MVDTDTPLVETEERDGVLVVRLNRPSKLNAINRELLDELLGVLEDATENPTKSLLFTGAGRAMCSGVDLEIVELPIEEKPEFKSKEHRMFDLIHSYPRPTAVAGRGAVIGAAFIVALDADFVVLGEDAVFSFPEIKDGIFSARTTAALERIVGPKQAKEIVLTGEPVAPERARELGLVTDVVPAEEVEKRALELVAAVDRYDAAAVESTKSMLTYSFPGPGDEEFSID